MEKCDALSQELMSAAKRLWAPVSAYTHPFTTFFVTLSESIHVADDDGTLLFFVVDNFTCVKLLASEGD